MSSWIWKYFDKTGDVAVCKDCGASLSAKSTTWGLRRHLQTKHQIECPLSTTANSTLMHIKCDDNSFSNDEADAAVQKTPDVPNWQLEEANQPGSSNGYSTAIVARSPKKSEIACSPSEAAEQPGSSNGYSTGQYGNFSRRSTTPEPGSQLTTKHITCTVAKMIAVDMLPLSFCENKGFRNLMELVVPDYTVPTKHTIKRSIDKLHSDTKGMLAVKLNEYDSVSISMASWSSRESATYLTIMVNAITTDWETISHTISTVEIHQWHTADNFRQHIEKVIAEWQLSEKIVATVHENTTNITMSVKKSKSLGASVACLTDTLHNAVSKALRHGDINKLLKKASNVVKYFNNSTVAAEALRRAQVESSLPTHKLLQNLKARWDSIFYTVQRLLEQRAAVMSVLDDNRTSTSKLTITGDDWRDLQRLEELLEPLEALTTIISAESDATLSLTRPLVHGLLKNFYTTDDSESDFQTSFKSVIRSDFLERFLETTAEPSGVALMSTFLDPRYKDLSGESESVIAETTKAIQDKLDELSESTSCNARSLNRRAALDLLLTGRRNHESSTRTCSEISTYITEPCIVAERDPCQWWKENQYKYPILSALARRYLAIPATLTPVERVFTNAGNIITTKRSRLTPENVDQLIFMHQNADLT